jgi:serine/threonine-protein kinase
METIPLTPVEQHGDEPSGPKVACVRGPAGCFTDEMTCLLRTRLRAVSLVLAVGLGAFLLLSLAEPLLWLRLAVFGVAAGCHLLLRSDRVLAAPQLRIVEMVLFGAVGLQLLVGQTVHMTAAGAAGDPVAAVSAVLSSFTAWIILMMIYAIFVPSTPKHSAVIATIATLAPLAVTLVLVSLNGDVAGVTHVEQPLALGFGLFLAAFALVYGTHTVSSLRREAFQARQFGQYRLKEKLGAGGMGEVYEAEHQLLKRPSAIKLIRPGQDADPTTIARFEREVQTMASLSHWNTVDVYDYGRTADGTFYYVMELLPGLSLDKLVRRHGPMPAARVVHLLRQVCGALQEAHAIGLIHRDVKPANVFAARRGGMWDVAKLLDFGLVKEHAMPSESPQLTQPGTFSGSPQFMAPEQATKFSAVDARCDIYSLGAVAYLLLTGRPPFLGDSPMEIVIAHSRDLPVPPSEIEPGVPRDVQDVVLHCLEKKPADRFPDAASLEQALAACGCANAWTQAEAAAWWRENEPDVR